MCVYPGVEWLIGYDLVLFIAWTVWIFSKLKKGIVYFPLILGVVIWTSV